MLIFLVKSDSCTVAEERLIGKQNVIDGSVPNLEQWTAVIRFLCPPIMYALLTLFVISSELEFCNNMGDFLVYRNWNFNKCESNTADYIVRANTQNSSSC